MTYAKFSPRRPIKSFQDLEVYQKLLAVSVAVAKRIGTKVNGDGSQKAGINGIGSGLASLALELPVKIARAHSVRFSDKTRAIGILEDVMLGINILIVYLEQYRDIENPSTGSGQVELEFFEEQIGSLLTCRWKVMHLARSWEKFSQTQE